MFMARIHQCMSAYHIHIFGCELSHFGKCFYFHPFSSKIQDVIFFLSEQYSNFQKCHTFFIHSPINGLFPGIIIIIENTSIMNTVEQMLLWNDWASRGYIHKSGIAGSLGWLTPNFLRYSHSVFQSSCITLQIHQHEMSVSLTQHTLQQRLSLVFLIQIF